MLTDENIRLAIKKSAEHKKNKRIVRRVCSDVDRFIPIIRDYAVNFKNPVHCVRVIYDGSSRKERTIVIPGYFEQVLHHMCVNAMMPMLTKGMYEHTYASIPGRGGHKGKKTVEKWIKKDKANTKYCLKMDIRHFFGTIPHDILREKLSKYIRDEKFLSLLDEIFSATAIGLPLGFYTSQWLANWYLQEFDHFVKEKLKAKYYIRYNDDMVIFGSNKRELHHIKDEIKKFLKEKLGLTLKDNWQVFRFDYIENGEHKGRALDFMGFKFYRDRTTLRKRIMLSTTRKARRIYKKKERTTAYDFKQLMSHLGWFSCTDTYNVYLVWIKPIINVQYCKRRISAYDKRKAKKG